MVDAVPAAAGRATLERAELVDQARIIEQLDATAVSIANAELGIAR